MLHGLKRDNGESGSEGACLCQSESCLALRAPGSEAQEWLYAIQSAGPEGWRWSQSGIEYLADAEDLMAELEAAGQRNLRIVLCRAGAEPVALILGLPPHSAAASFMGWTYLDPHALEGEQPAVMDIEGAES